MKLALPIALSLLVSPFAATFTGAPEPASTTPSPATPAAQQKTFSLPPGFEIELVASEDHGVGKPVTVAWDDAGRLWTITALEYPLDGNEQPAEAKALYERGGADKILVFDSPYGAPRQPRVFADNLAMPMGILPYKDGALVGHGPDVLFLRDTDGDGKADKREVILTGFGIQDSHLMPHQFTRAPGGWFWLAQGAFNYSRVKTKDGREHQFDQTRLARFTLDGLKFESVTSGPCNIWGLVIDQQGETFIQEANDYGYPVMHYQQGGSYPGCTGSFTPYAPYHPSEVEFRMGGTGLSGLALSDPRGGFSDPYADVMYVANPITRKIQAIKIHREGPRFRYEKLADFVLSSDEWFRPVALHFGPDQNLYIIDWYNKIISHNEVPRTHPERDKTRGRIWRVRQSTQSRAVPPNVLAAKNDALLQHLRSDNTWEMRAAVHQVIDRSARELLPQLRDLVLSKTATAPHRIHALWILEELKALEPSTIQALLTEQNRNLRREAIRALQNAGLPARDTLALAESRASDPDPEVRAEVIRSSALHLPEPQAFSILLSLAQAPLDQPAGINPHNGSPMKLREAYDREFERYLIRSYLEKFPAPTAAFLESNSARLDAEAILLASLALPPDRGGPLVAKFISQLTRLPNEEELLRLAQNLGQPGALAAMEKILSEPSRQNSLLESLLRIRTRADLTALAPLLSRTITPLFNNSASQSLAIRIAGAFKLQQTEPLLVTALRASSSPKAELLRALRELDSKEVALFAQIARDATDPAIRNEAVSTLAASKSPATPGLLLPLWDSLSATQRRFALGELVSTKSTAEPLLAAIKEGTVPREDLDGNTLDRLATILPANPQVTALVRDLSTRYRPILLLNGQNGSSVDSNINLEGPFTVECWVKLDPGIENDDGILGRPGGADFNFAGSRFRVYCGPDFGDRLIAKKQMTPGVWTHHAITRDAAGKFRLYLNGEFDTEDNRPVTALLDNLDIGRVSPQHAGTSGALAEFRVWNRARSASEIRADFDRTYAGEPKPTDLVHLYTDQWPGIRPLAQVLKTAEAPTLLTRAQAAAQHEKLEKFAKLAASPGSVEKGQASFTQLCAVCHSIRGTGGQIGPVLDGAGASGPESLLRAVLTPNAAMEAGYRAYRVELTDGELLEGFLVSQDAESLLLRRPSLQDERIPRSKIKRASFTRNSLMPEGLLELLSDEDARDLLTFLLTLK